MPHMDPHKFGLRDALAEVIRPETEPFTRNCNYIFCRMYSSAADPSTRSSVVFLGDLENGEGEWRNMQLIVRRSFKDCFERLGRHQDTLDHLSKVVIGVNERLSTRVTTQDVLKLLESEDFKRKVKQDVHLQERMDKLEYNTTRLGSLRSDMERKADINYVDSSCAQKVDKTDVTIRALLSDTIKGDLTSLRAELRDVKAKLNAQEVVQAQQAQTRDDGKSVLSDLQTLAREMGGVKARLEAYPGYAQLMSIIERKADKSSLEAALSSITTRARDSSEGNATSAQREREKEREGEIYVLKAAMEKLQTTAQEQARAISALQRGHYTSIGLRDVGLGVGVGVGEDGDGDGDGDSLIDRLTPIKRGGGRSVGRSGGSGGGGGTGNSREGGPSLEDAASAPAGSAAATSQVQVQVVSARMDSLSLAVQALSSDREKMQDRIVSLETQLNKMSAEREENAACVLAANKLAARAEAAVELSSRRIGALETINQQRLVALDERLLAIQKRLDRAEKGVKTAVAAAAAAAASAADASDRTGDGSSKFDKFDGILKEHLHRIKKLEAAAALAAKSSAPPTSASASASAHDIWEQWRSAVLDHVHSASKSLLHEIRLCQDALAATNAGGKALANSAYSRAEEAIDEVRRLRLAQVINLSPSTNHNTATAASNNAAGAAAAAAALDSHSTPIRAPFIRSHSHSHSRSPSVWIGDNHYTLDGVGEGESERGAESKTVKEGREKARDETYSSTANAAGHTVRTPLSATSAALDARIARLRTDKEDLRRLSQSMRVASIGR